MSCPTCQLVRGIMLGQGIPAPVVEASMPIVNELEDRAVRVVKRKASAYSKKYARAFKKVAHRYKKKAGGWKQNGFKNAQKAAHKLAKGMK